MAAEALQRFIIYSEGTDGQTLVGSLTGIQRGVLAPCSDMGRSHEAGPRPLGNREEGALWNPLSAHILGRVGPQALEKRLLIRNQKRSFKSESHRGMSRTLRSRFL